MKGRLIAIEPGPRAMAVLLTDGRPEDLLIDPPEGEAQPFIGEIHRVRVRRLLKKQGAATVKLAGGADGWLKDAGDVSEGDITLAEVTGYAEEGKAVPLTGRRLHRGRWSILTPLAPGVNVARSIKNPDERDRLSAIGEAALGSSPAGLIMRSAAPEADEEELKAEIATLLAREAQLAEGGPPGQALPAPGAVETALREWDADEVIEEAGVFERLGVWDHLYRLKEPRAALPGGASMIIEPTAALIAVDVNTGADTAHDAARRANLAAAGDILRQLRLRGLGGQVVIDFAPMRKQDRKAVESVLARAISACPVQTTMIGWTGLGHLELTRKRERRATAALIPDV